MTRKISVAEKILLAVVVVGCVWVCFCCGFVVWAVIYAHNTMTEFVLPIIIIGAVFLIIAIIAMSDIWFE